MILVERHGNLFANPDNFAHCVSSDFHMSAGIAVEFRDRYGHKSSLLSEGYRVGQVARRIGSDHNYVFYLVTKQRYFMKPTYHSLQLTLTELAKWCELLNLKSLSIPPISCCRDRLSWLIVREMVWNSFKGLNIVVTVYH